MVAENGDSCSKCGSDLTKKHGVEVVINETKEYLGSVDEDGEICFDPDTENHLRTETKLLRCRECKKELDGDDYNSVYS